MNILLHTCCGPCAIECLAFFRTENMEPAAYFNNPNIHPYKEYEARLESLARLCDRTETRLIADGGYGLRRFLSQAENGGEARCGACYRMRLRDTARYAAQNGFDCFSTTLLISPYQNHALIKETGESAALLFGIPFYYHDFRPLFYAGQNEARKSGLYRQSYCGCVFSEEERWRKKEG